MTKKKKGATLPGDETKNNTTTRSDTAILQQCPLARALLEKDTNGIYQILEESLPKGVSAVASSVTVEKTLGEAFTGGRSTPVYQIQAVVERQGRSIPRRFIAKLVDMTTPPITITTSRGTTEEKLLQLRESYAVERRFYQHLAPMLQVRSELQFLNLPKLLYSDLDGSKAWPFFCILMNDVSVQHSSHPSPLSVDCVKAALSWIAKFHAIFGSLAQEFRNNLPPGGSGNESVKFIENKCPEVLGTSKSLLTFGKRLQHAGQAIQEKLNQLSQSPRYSTVIHGDYKAANMFFDPSPTHASSAVSVIDFQFTGYGVCSDDVAYLLFPDALGDFEDVEEELISFYHSELIEQLMIHGKGGPSTISLETFTDLLNLSRLDMTRYWMGKGWAASTLAEVSMMQQLDLFLSTRLGDGGRILDDYGEKLDSLIDTT